VVNFELSVGLFARKFELNDVLIVHDEMSRKHVLIKIIESIHHYKLTILTPESPDSGF
jgi:hypothetical protein